LAVSEFDSKVRAASKYQNARNKQYRTKSQK